MNFNLKLKNLALGLSALFFTLFIPSSQVQILKIPCVPSRTLASLTEKDGAKDSNCAIPLAKLIDRPQLEAKLDSARKSGELTVRIAGPFASATDAKYLLQSGFHRDSTTDHWVREIRENHPKIKFFDSVANAIEKNLEKIKQVLGKVETPYGVDFEIKVTLNSLRNIGDFELYHLDNTKTLNNVAVYPATNVPLYTLIAHGFIPASISKNVWFRTPQATREIYKELFDIIQADIPSEFTHGLHLLTEDRDVQYDNFRKMYVLGMNKRGSGADVARTRDGKWIIVEYNFGATSGTLEPGYYPIESHLIMENLQGKPTQLLSDLRRIHSEGVQAQSKYLQSRKNIKSVFWRRSADDFSAVDVGKYFRQLTLENWAKNPTNEEARQTLADIRKMFEGLEEKSGEDIPNIIKGAEYYIIKKLGHLPTEINP